MIRIIIFLLVLLSCAFRLDAQVDGTLDSLWKRQYIQHSLKQEVNSIPHSKIMPAFSDSILNIRFRSMNSPFQCGYHHEIKKYITLYTISKRRAFEAALGLSAIYFPGIEKALQDVGLESEFKYICLSSSAFDMLNHSADGGAGIWHLPYPVASRFGLRMNAYYDERCLSYKSTFAAIKYLQLLKKEFSDPSLQIAAWFCGVPGVKRAIKRSGGLNTLWEIYPFLPEDSRKYIPAFFAAYYCVEHKDDFRLKQYEIELPKATDTILIKKRLNLKAIEVVAGIPVISVREANPAMCSDIVPDHTPYPLHLSGFDVNKFRQMKDSIYTYQDSVLLKKEEPLKARKVFDGNPPKGSIEKYYTVKQGDNLGFIAEKFHVTASAIRKWNNIDGDMIYLGQVIRIFVPEKFQTEKKKPRKNTNGNEAEENNEDYIYYTVKEGESLWIIAKRFHGISAENIMELNQIDNNIRPGQKLKIRKKED